MTFLLAYWREALIAILLGSCFFAVRSCQSAHDKVVQIQTEDRALADQAKAQAEEQKRKDVEDYENAKHDFQEQITQLAADHRIASVQCVRHTTSGSSTVPTQAITPAGTSTKVAADVPPAITFDPGRQLDDLTREADIVVARCNALVDWVMATR